MGVHLALFHVVGLVEDLRQLVRQPYHLWEAPAAGEHQESSRSAVATTQQHGAPGRLFHQKMWEQEQWFRGLSGREKEGVLHKWRISPQLRA